MMKLGVTTVRQLDHPATRFGRRRDASLLLLERLARTPPADLRCYDRLMERLLMPNGTWRETQRGRFSQLDPLTRDILHDRFSSHRSLAVTDCGVSNGAASVELYHTMRRVFPALDFVATDLWRHAIVVKSRRRPWAVIFEPGGAELQIVIGKLVLPGQGSPSPTYPVNRLARRLARAWLIPRARAVLQRFDAGAQSDFAVDVIDDYEVMLLPLLSFDCWRLSLTQPDFRFEVQDLFRPSPRQAHAVRVMNVLTRTYFDDARLRQAIGYSLDSVLPNGVFIAGRSPTANPRDVLATIFGRGADGLEVVSRLNGGCEEETLVLETAKATR